MLNLLQPWVNKQRRVVSADSYFALVQACGELKKCGLKFIGVVKIATRGFCMVKLSGIELALRGLWKGYFALDKENKLDKFAFVWVDRYWRYFIFNTSSLKPGMPYSRYRLRNVDTSHDTYLVRVQFEINDPRVTEICYSKNSKIEGSNRTRQDDFNWRGDFRPRIVVSELILQYLELMVLIPNISLRLVSGGMTGTLNSSTTIF